MDYAVAYSRVCRYAASSRDVTLLLREMATDPSHLEPGSPLRLALADALTENGQHAEAAHATSAFPMSIRDGKPLLSTLRLHRMLRQMSRYYSDRHLAGGEPTPLRLETANQLDKLGRTAEANILRSSHPVHAHTRSPLKQNDRPVVSHAITGDYPRFGYGGGEMYYWVGQGSHQDVLCHNCANGENGSPVLEAEAADDPQWTLNHELNGHVHEEGPPLQCCHCNREIPSAYGDPDNPEDA